jgi:PAS domain-containing protein
LTFVDITRRREAEGRQRQSDARVRALIANLPGAAAFIVGPDLRYVLAEGEALGSLGVKSGDLVGRTIF